MMNANGTSVLNHNRAPRKTVPQRPASYKQTKNDTFHKKILQRICIWDLGIVLSTVMHRCGPSMCVHHYSNASQKCISKPLQKPASTTCWWKDICYHCSYMDQNFDQLTPVLWYFFSGQKVYSCRTHPGWCFSRRLTLNLIGTSAPLVWTCSAQTLTSNASQEKGAEPRFGHVMLHILRNGLSRQRETGLSSSQVILSKNSCLKERQHKTLKKKHCNCEDTQLHLLKTGNVAEGLRESGFKSNRTSRHQSFLIKFAKFNFLVICCCLPMRRKNKIYHKHQRIQKWISNKIFKLLPIYIRKNVF